MWPYQHLTERKILWVSGLSAVFIPNLLPRGATQQIVGVHLWIRAQLGLL